jgi:NADPH-dependent ferric siderophore reductase
VTNAPHGSSLELAERLKTNARVCQVVDSRSLSSSIQEVALRGDAVLLTGVPGNDVMVRLGGDATFVRRRYSVRQVDAELDEFRLWICTIHDGPGSQWAKDARAGDAVDVVGPRGKIPLDPDADWHLFVSDMTGYSASYRMAQSITAPGRAIFIVEIDQDDDAQTAAFDEGVEVSAVFVSRADHERHDPARLLLGLSDFNLLPGVGHAYLFGEFSVTKVVREALLDRGLSDEQISRKAFWRSGRANAEHGEPIKDEV